MKNICFQMNRKAWLAIAMALFMAFPALAQKVTVTGTVYEPDGEPAIGASVTVKGTPGVGAATDLDGNFRISVAPNATLVVSYVGLETQEIELNGRTHIEVHLAENANVLNEFVVVGYGQVKKQDATGSVAVIKPDDIEAGIATSANDLLVGASPGVVVTTDGGNPGGGAQIRIRGGASLNASNDPLIVIDGVPMYGSYGSANPMTMIAPSNIESLTILKDASATAIYGSRASNGVIIITTKKGQSGRPQVNFAANFKINTARRTWGVLDGDQYRKIVNLNCDESSQALLGSANTNWQKEVLRTSFSHDYDLSIGGTAGFLPYRVNVSYTDNKGIIKTSEMQRTTVGFNLTPKFFNGLLQLQANAKGSYIVDDNADTGSIGAAIGFNPTLPVYTHYHTHGNTGLTYMNGYTTLLNQDGNKETNGSTNPLAMLYGVKNGTKAWSSTGNFMADYALHFLPELHLNLNLGYDVYKGYNNSYNLENSSQAWNDGYKNGAASHYHSYTLSRNTMLTFFANYKKEFAAIKSNVDFMVGYDWQRRDYHNKNYGRRFTSLGFTKQYDPMSQSWNINYDESTAANIGHNYGATEEARNYTYRDAGQINLMSFYGRLNYIFDDTYLLTFTLRDDGTSRFAKDNRWGLFPAVALGWKINNMPFMEGFDKLSELKLRLGWGKTGQQDVGGYNSYASVYSISQPSVYYPSVNGGDWISPLYPNPNNANLKWESTTTYNVAIDYSWLNNRINGSLEWYLRDTDDLLAYVPVPAGMTTTNAMNRNIGSLRNIGVDFSINAKPVVTQDFTWNTGFNINWNKNKITALTGSSDEDQNFKLGAGGNPASENAGDILVHKVGYAAASFYVLEQCYDKYGNPIPDCYVDQNQDGVINDNDLVIKHSRDPKVTVNWNNSFNYKNWDLGFVLRASIGNYVFNAMRAGKTNLYNLRGQGNILNNVLDSDFYFNDGAAVTNLVRSDYFLENAGYIRCDNITLGYTFNNLLNDKLNLRLYGAVQNVFVISKYKGIDPEIASGLDNNAYPRPITASVGLVATF